MVEQLTLNQRVLGSSPSASTKFSSEINSMQGNRRKVIFSFCVLRYKLRYRFHVMRGSRMFKKVPAQLMPGGRIPSRHDWHPHGCTAGTGDSRVQITRGVQPEAVLHRWRWANCPCGPRRVPHALSIMRRDRLYADRSSRRFRTISSGLSRRPTLSARETALA